MLTWVDLFFSGITWTQSPSSSTSSGDSWGKTASTGTHSPNRLRILSIFCLRVAASEVTLKVGSDVSVKGEQMEFLCGTEMVYERDMGVIGGLIGDNGRSVESLAASEASEV